VLEQRLVRTPVLIASGIVVEAANAREYAVIYLLRNCSDR